MVTIYAMLEKRNLGFVYRHQSRRRLKKEGKKQTPLPLKSHLLPPCSSSSGWSDHRGGFYNALGLCYLSSSLLRLPSGINLPIPLLVVRNNLGQIRRVSGRNVIRGSSVEDSEGRGGKKKEGC